jgi:hypothetical protein
MEPNYYSLDSVAAELDLARQDVETVAMVELANDEWDEDMEAVTEAGREVLLGHFSGGEDPAG